MPEITCTRCGLTIEAKPTKKGVARLPRGWKEHNGRWCPNCWRAAWMLRAITFRVAGPVDGTWADLRETLRDCWRNATTVSNWAVRELSRADVVRTPDLEKLPPMPRVYLYPGAREIAPDMDPQSVTAVLQAVERKYRERRYDVIWQRKASGPSYRYPAPYPVHNQGWRAELGPDNEALISVRLGGRRWTLRLAGGPGFARQRRAFLRLVAGEAVHGELALYPVAASGGDHRPGMDDRRQSRLVAKLVMWLPKEEREGRGGVLYVRTTGDSLLVYHTEGGEPRHLHADQARRWAAEHRRRLQRLSDDTKAEKRKSRRQLRGLQDRREAWARKHRHRMDSLTHEASAAIAGFARRQGVGRVVYDDTDKSYVPEGFPWAELRQKLQYKLAGEGITFEIAGASGEVVDESPESLELQD